MPAPLCNYFATTCIRSCVPLLVGLFLVPAVTLFAGWASQNTKLSSANLNFFASYAPEGLPKVLQKENIAIAFARSSEIDDQVATFVKEKFQLSQNIVWFESEEAMQLSFLQKNVHPVINESIDRMAKKFQEKYAILENYTTDYLTNDYAPKYFKSQEINPVINDSRPIVFGVVIEKHDLKFEYRIYFNQDVIDHYHYFNIDKFMKKIVRGRYQEHQSVYGMFAQIYIEQAIQNITVNNYNNVEIGALPQNWRQEKSDYQKKISVNGLTLGLPVVFSSFICARNVEDYFVVLKRNGVSIQKFYWSILLQQLLINVIYYFEWGLTLRYLEFPPFSTFGYETVALFASVSAIAQSGFQIFLATVFRSSTWFLIFIMIAEFVISLTDTVLCALIDFSTVWFPIVFPQWLCEAFTILLPPHYVAGLNQILVISAMLINDNPDVFENGTGGAGGGKPGAGESGTIPEPPKDVNIINQISGMGSYEFSVNGLTFSLPAIPTVIAYGVGAFVFFFFLSQYLGVVVDRQSRALPWWYVFLPQRFYNRRKQLKEMENYDVDQELTIKGLNVSYKNCSKKTVILENVALKTKAQINALIGASGSGKTSICRIIAGQSDPTSVSEFKYGNIDLKDKFVQYRLRRLIGICPQDQSNVLPRLTIKQNVTLAIQFNISRDRKELEELSKMLFVSLGLAQHTKKRFDQLSGGMQRRLSLMLLLLQTPRILILDEITANVDLVLKRQIWETLDQYLQKYRPIIILTSHDVKEIAYISKQIIEIQNKTTISKEISSLYGVTLITSNYVDIQTDNQLSNIQGTLRNMGNCSFSITSQQRLLQSATKSQPIGIHEETPILQVSQQILTPIANGYDNQVVSYTNTQNQLPMIDFQQDNVVLTPDEIKDNAPINHKTRLIRVMFFQISLRLLDQIKMGFYDLIIPLILSLTLVLTYFKLMDFFLLPEEQDFPSKMELRYTNYHLYLQQIQEVENVTHKHLKKIFEDFSKPNHLFSSQTPCTWMTKSTILRAWGFPLISEYDFNMGSNFYGINGFANPAYMMIDFINSSAQPLTQENYVSQIKYFSQSAVLRNRSGQIYVPQSQQDYDRSNYRFYDIPLRGRWDDKKRPETEYYLAPYYADVTREFLLQGIENQSITFQGNTYEMFARAPMAAIEERADSTAIYFTFPMRDAQQLIRPFYPMLENDSNQQFQSVENIDFYKHAGKNNVEKDDAYVFSFRQSAITRANQAFLRRQLRNNFSTDFETSTNVQINGRFISQPALRNMSTGIRGVTYTTHEIGEILTGMAVYPFVMICVLMLFGYFQTDTSKERFDFLENIGVRRIKIFFATFVVDVCHLIVILILMFGFLLLMPEYQPRTSDYNLCILLCGLQALFLIKFILLFTNEKTIVMAYLFITVAIALLIIIAFDIDQLLASVLSIVIPGVYYLWLLQYVAFSRYIPPWHLAIGIIINIVEIMVVFIYQAIKSHKQLKINELQVALEARNISVAFKKNQILKDFNIQIPTNQKACIMGQNGCGKSTFIKCILGQQNHSGNIQLSQKVSIVQQQNHNFARLSAQNNLRLIQILSGVQQNSKDLLKQVNLTKCTNTNAKKMSGGEQKRLMIAMVLAAKNGMVVLDEFSAGLDPESKEIVWSLINKMKDRTLLFVTHDTDEVQKLGEVVYFVVDGRLQCTMSKENIAKKQQQKTVIIVNGKSSIGIQKFGKTFVFAKSNDELLDSLQQLRNEGFDRAVFDHDSVEFQYLELVGQKDYF